MSLRQWMRTTFGGVDGGQETGSGANVTAEQSPDDKHLARRYLFDSRPIELWVRPNVQKYIEQGYNPTDPRIEVDLLHCTQEERALIARFAVMNKDWLLELNVGRALLSVDSPTKEALLTALRDAAAQTDLIARFSTLGDGQ